MATAVARFPTIFFFNTTAQLLLILILVIIVYIRCFFFLCSVLLCRRIFFLFSHRRGGGDVAAEASILRSPPFRDMQLANWCVQPTPSILGGSLNKLNDSCTRTALSQPTLSRITLAASSYTGHVREKERDREETNYMWPIVPIRTHTHTHSHYISNLITYCVLYTL